jgi:hypothetical protein
MNIRTSWNKFWFSPAAYFDLAVVRIIAVLVQVVYMVAEQFSDLQYVYTLPATTYRPLPVLHLFVFAWGFHSPPPSQVVFALYGIVLLCGFASLVGLFTRVVLVIFALGSLFLQAFVFSFQQYHHPEAIMIIALLALALGPSGQVLSVDSALRRWRQGQAQTVPLLDYSSPYAGWPVLFIQCIYPLVYISAAVAKLAYNHYTLDWANGYTLQYYLIQDDIRKELPFAAWASQFHVMIFLSQIVVILYQCTYYLVIPYRKLRWIYLPVGAFFHLANYIVLDAPFPQWIALLAAYIPFADCIRYLATKRVVVEPSAEGA